MVGMAEVGAPISLDGVAVYPDCWCICLYYLSFAPENPEDGEMYLLVPAHPGCPIKSPESSKMVVCVCLCVRMCVSACVRACVCVSRVTIIRPNTALYIYTGCSKKWTP